MSRKVQGCVVIQVVVEADGKVRRYRVSHSLEESLDLASTEALKEWEFVINSSVPLCLVPSLVAR